MMMMMMMTTTTTTTTVIIFVIFSRREAEPFFETEITSESEATVFSNHDVAKVLVKASLPKLLQLLPRYYAASNNENTLFQPV
jgi:hypothetical protein